MIRRTRLLDWLYRRMLDLIARREYDVAIGGHERPYMLRWYLTPWSGWYRDVPDGRKTWWQWFTSHLPNVYLHVILRDDDDRALHDHPWPFVSLTLEGGYYEHTIERGGVHLRRWFGRGTLKFRGPRHAHRLELMRGTPPLGPARLPCTTLVVTGPRVRHWGFHCRTRWVHWRDFTDPATKGQTVGRGCE